MTSPTLTLLVADAYMRGAWFAVSDTADVMVMEHTPGLCDDLMPELRAHGNELRDLILDGIHKTINGFQPALDGLDRVESDHARP